MTCDICFISPVVSKACVYFFESLHRKKKKKQKPPIFWLSFSYYTYENWCHTIRLTGFPTWSPHQDLRLSSARRARTSYIPGLGRHRACPEATLRKRLLPPSMNDLQTNASAWFFPSPNACLCFNIYSWFCLKGRRLPIPELKGIQFLTDLHPSV